MYSIYILCKFDKDEYTYVFNESDNEFQEIKGVEKNIYNVTFNEAYIIANKTDIELTINRVSGKASKASSDSSVIGSCDLFDRTKF